MGSEKKKKRRHSDVEEAASNHVDAEKAERKRLKKARRESITNVEKDAVAEVQADIPTLVSPIATRKFFPP